MIILDTHVLVWMTADPKKLSASATAAIKTAQTEDGVAISAISLWELASLLSRGRIHAYGTVESSISLLIESVSVKPITPEIAALSAQFSDDYPRDPADRLIGATARAEGIGLVTHNKDIRRTKLLKTIW